MLAFFVIIGVCALALVATACFSAWQQGQERRREAYVAHLKREGWATVNYRCRYCNTLTQKSPAVSVECCYCEGEVLIEVPKDWRAPKG